MNTDEGYIINKTLVEKLRKEKAAILKSLEAATKALRSYQYGNASPDLAKEIADHGQKVLEEFGEQS